MADKKIICPLRGVKCIEDGGVVDGELVGCRFWTHVSGINPQTGQQMDMHDCAIAWIPLLLIENSKEQRATAREVETLRNEVVPAQNAAAGVMTALLQAVRNPQPERDDYRALPGEGGQRCLT